MQNKEIEEFFHEPHPPHDGPLIISAMSFAALMDELFTHIACPLCRALLHPESVPSYYIMAQEIYHNWVTDPDDPRNNWLPFRWVTPEDVANNPDSDSDESESDNEFDNDSNPESQSDDESNSDTTQLDE